MWRDFSPHNGDDASEEDSADDEEAVEPPLDRRGKNTLTGRAETIDLHSIDRHVRKLFHWL